jgi:hypothetical protein
MEQLDSHQTDFREILYSKVLLQFVDAHQFYLKPEKNNTFHKYWPTFMTTVTVGRVAQAV